jgi:hypothetical protein
MREGRPIPSALERSSSTPSPGRGRPSTRLLPGHGALRRSSTPLSASLPEVAVGQGTRPDHPPRVRRISSSSSRSGVSSRVLNLSPPGPTVSSCVLPE